jgi:ribosomal protein S18 acetylase RimI-like enzyme
MNNLNYTNKVPDVEEFMALRVSAGLSRNDPDAATAGLAGTCFSVCVRDAERLVAMGRVIGDGGCFFQVVDVAVHPEYQRRGIGLQVMTRLMEQLREHAPKTAYVSLFADGNAARLYEKFGFERTTPASTGMALRL